MEFLLLIATFLYVDEQHNRHYGNWTFNVIYALVARFAHFNIGQYMLDANIFQIGMASAKSVYTRAVIVGLIFLFVEIVLLCMVMRKKDIK